MYYAVKIIQRLEGYVAVESDSHSSAEQTADKHYNGDGNELPDMDDVESLKFEAEALPGACNCYVLGGGCSQGVEEGRSMGACIFSEDGELAGNRESCPMLWEVL